MSLTPGSDEAIEQGCTCPAIDNGRGNAHIAQDRGGWWIDADCPIHAVIGREENDNDA